MIPIFTNISELQFKAKEIAQQFRLPFCEHFSDINSPYLLQLSETGLRLVDTNDPNRIILFIDFLHGKSRHRQLFGGGKNQLIAKACGLTKIKQPLIVDATAGLGQDAFVLATLSAKVIMIERHPVVAALLADALQRLQQNGQLPNTLIPQLYFGDALELLPILSEKHAIDVIYLDPMYPLRRKSALVKQELRILRTIVGNDSDIAPLLTLARQIARRRVVVKRPRLAESLVHQQPDLVFTGKSSRFDVYHAISLRPGGASLRPAACPRDPENKK